MNYAQKTKWCITWSKLKVFNRDQLLYKLIYEDMVEIEEEEKRYFVTWSAFHHIMEYWPQDFLEHYYIDEWLVKKKQLEYILDYHWENRDADKIKEAKKRLLPDVRAEYMKLVWADAKIELTPAEGRDCLGMYEEALKQPMRDLGWDYIKEHRFEAMYRWLKLTAQLDRLLVTDKNWKRYTIEEIDDLLLGKHKEEQKKVIWELWLESTIRDFKTSWDIGRLHKEMMYWDESKDYILSMSFYYTIIYVLYGLESSVYLDVIEKSAPYVTDTIKLLPWILQNCLKEKIKPLLDSVIKSQETWIYDHKAREQRVMNSKAKKYIQYHPEYLQSSPTVLELDFI